MAVFGAGVVFIASAFILDVGGVSAPLQAVRRSAVVRRRYFMRVALGEGMRRGNARVEKMA